MPHLGILKTAAEISMKCLIQIIIAALSIGLLSENCKATDTSKEIRDLYTKFYTAQNARDLDKVALEIAAAPEFLWVSDGKSIWGRQVAIERMRTFQQAEVWRVDPNLQAAKVVEASKKTAYLHLPLDLVIGTAASPDRIHFLVSALCVKTTQGWKIAALFTTTAKPD